MAKFTQRFVKSAYIDVVIDADNIEEAHRLFEELGQTSDYIKFVEANANYAHGEIEEVEVTKTPYCGRVSLNELQIEDMVEGASPIPASVVLRRWVNNYAIEVDTVEFDCRLALDGIDLCYFPNSTMDIHGCGYFDYGDDIFYKAVALGLVEPWDGPFDCYIDDEEAYSRYLEKRIKREYGYDTRKED